jgi:hypothetical protein
VAKTTIINTTTIIKIKIPVVFTLIIFYLASIKVLKKSCVPFTPNSNRRRYYSLSLLPPVVYSLYVFTFCVVLAAFDLGLLKPHSYQEKAFDFLNKDF